MTPAQFQIAVLHWYDHYGRHDLPWHQVRTPYTVWLSEIMLQQTQVTTVIPYFQRFIARFPTIELLAQADLDSVLHLWSGLGYYSRARNLHRCAQIVTAQGQFPATIQALQALPGIGRSTAAAIIAQAYEQPAAILDGNVKRLLARFYAVSGWPGERRVENQLWQLSAALVPAKRVRDYTQAVMDLGSMVCRRSKPRCHACPVQSHCMSFKQNLQSILPHKKARAVLPLRATTMLIIQDKDRKTLLIRRPAIGIWGGLWCFPQCQEEDDIIQFCRQEFKLMVRLVDKMSMFRHTFSHFHLDITPVRLICHASVHAVGEEGAVGWYHSDELRRLGLPQPVKKILNTLLSEVNSQ